MTQGVKLLLTAALLSAAPIPVRDLPPLLQPLAGQFVGVIGDTLVVAGGTYWTAPPTEGGKKIWVDRIQILPPQATAWRDAGRLPEALSYGGAVSLADSLVLIGGLSSTQVSPSVVRLTLRDGKIAATALPSLPGPSANLAAAPLSGRVYAIAGQTVWSLDTSHPETGWRNEPALPGAARILPAATACGNALYLVSGAELVGGKRRYLRDAWRFNGKSWTRLPDLPAPKRSQRALPEGLVTTGAALRQGAVVIAGGEDRPGSRSARVLAMDIP